MKQFILPVPPDADGTVRLTEKDFHYLVRVRRMGPGTVFDALLPSGEPLKIRVASVDGACLTGVCLAVKAEAAPDPALPPILLFQALPKGARMDLIVRQATEGGITEIVPFLSAYAAHQIPIDTVDSSANRLNRWQRIIKEARQQSGSGVATSIKAPCTVDALLKYWEALQRRCPRARGILLHPGPTGSNRPLEQGTFHGYLDSNPDLVAVLIGPEGGFSPEEADQFQAAGFKPLIMGDTILRTETAALYAAAAIRIILLEKPSWELKIPASLSESTC
ncbi:ribosomal RNA small subunit methyltransferase E [Spirochaetia bacterium]|nr:ribosomal RNA small subunit methyltransferase E [Spirochaetia bacterium]